MFKYKIVASFLVFGLLFSFSSFSFSQTSSIAKKFSEYDSTSTLKINHKPLSDILEETVLPIGRSYKILGNEKPDSYRGSRIKVSKSLSASRFEGNRVFFHAFTDDHKDFFLAYQEGLERLTNRKPLQRINKDEQLAYWLNLYNVIVINKVIAEYPIQKLKRFRSTKRGKPSFWTEKVTTIEGVPLSLTDIEKILFTNFDSPLVAFGLWQGSIGGPSLANHAYTGGNVWHTLERNAVEFVNSNRGLRLPKGTWLAVSKYYEWVMPAFGTSPEHVLMFIKEYADPNFVPGISAVSSLNFNFYDWTIADLLGGSKHSGGSNQMGGVLTGKSAQVGLGSGGGGGGTGGGPGSGGGAGGGSVAGIEGGGGGISSTSSNFFDLTKGVEGLNITGLPDSALKLIQGIVENSRRPRPVITTLECAPGEDCTIENVDGEGF